MKTPPHQPDPLIKKAEKMPVEKRAKKRNQICATLADWENEEKAKRRSARHRAKAYGGPTLY